MPGVLSKEAFIAKVEKKFPGLYTYDKVVYKNMVTCVTITCKEHGDFDKEPDYILQGWGCKYCPNKSGKSYKLTPKAAIQRCVDKWGDKVDYSKTVYTGAGEYGTFRCIEHDNVYKQKFQHHWSFNGCKLCAKLTTKKTNKLLKEDNPELFAQINIDRTVILDQDIDINLLTTGSHKHVMWNCAENPEHIWDAEIRRRSYGEGCHYCSGNKVHITTCLAIMRPDIAEIWYDTSKLTPYDVTVSSHEEVYWKCNEGCKPYIMPVCKKTSGYGCPACSGRLLSDKNRLSLKYKDIAAEWHPTKNIGTPDDYSYGSSYYASWICDRGHEWQTSINGRTNNNSGCPYCSARAAYSKSAIEWLESIIKDEGSYIQHALNGGEYKIPGTRWRADGYHRETNTIFEFYGSYWHGDLQVYPYYGYNYRVSPPITFEELSERTMERENAIRRMGYTVVTMWESDWNRQKKELGL